MTTKRDFDIERFVEEAVSEAQERLRLPLPDHLPEGTLWTLAAAPDGLPEGLRMWAAAHLGRCALCRGRWEEFRRQLKALEERVEPYLSVSGVSGAPARVRPSTEGPAPARPRGLRGLPLSERARRRWEELLRPRGALRHALAYALGSALLFGLNALLNERFAPPPSPLGSPTQAPPGWWAPYAVGAWGGLLLLHLLAVGFRRLRSRSRKEANDHTSERR